MRLSSIGGNATEVEIAGVAILFSYAQPVAAMLPGRGFVRTDKKYSVTTTKHVNAWTPGGSEELPDEKFRTTVLEYIATLAQARLSP